MLKFSVDIWILLPVIFLSLFSLTILRSISPELFNNQLIFFLIGFGILIFLSSVDIRPFFTLHLPLYIISIFFLLIPMVVGTLTRGAVRWIPLGRFSLQPSELIKPFLLLTFTALATSPASSTLIRLVGLGLLPVLLIFRQPDLGTSLVVLSAWLFTLVYRYSFKILLLIFAMGLIASYPIYRYVLHDYQRHRLETFINPYTDPLGKGYHVIQSMIAVGSGQLQGRGLGRGTQSQLKFLPEYHTDFIFASISEELGFLGAFTCILLYCLLFWRIYIISQAQHQAVAAVYCLTSAGMLAFQVFVNIGMNMGLAPVTGITLPLLSYGGSSIISTFTLLGFVSSLSRHPQPRDFLI